DLFGLETGMVANREENQVITHEGSLPVQRWALTLAYDGRAFHGWQKQPDGLYTIQSVLEDALSSIAAEQINVVVAGRTDAGVHATGQVVHFDTCALFKDDLLTQAYLVSVAKNNPVKSQDVSNAYNDLVKYYSGTQEVQLGEILTRDTNTANQAIAQLKAKKSFSTVAKEYTIDPAGRDNGGIAKGFVSLKDLQESATPVYNAIKDLKKGQYTATPVQGNGNIYAVFYVNDKRNVKLPSQKEMEPILSRRLQSALIAQHIEQLYKSASIK
ncbi:Pseudouridylate synthase, partial [Snodgrassella alvi SCGC AB-598-O11]